MASLIQPLVVGYSDAASGTAEIYQRGTSTLSTQVYSDPDAQTAVTTHTLNAYGRVTRYVTERVDLVVKDAAGATVATIPDVCAVDARTVRIENSLFTGTNPNGNGQTISAGITTMQAALTLLRTSLGADDGYVLGSGSGAAVTEQLVKTVFGWIVRDNAVTSTTLTGVTYTPDDDYGIHKVTHSSGATMAFANPSGTIVHRDSAPLVVWYRNSTGTNRTPTWGTAYTGVPATAVATGTTALYLFRYSLDIGEWVAVTTSPVTTAA